MRPVPPPTPPITVQAPPSVRPTWAEVDRDALVHNVRVVGDAVGGARRILAVVKADAYGHGAAHAARAFVEAGVFGLAVSLVEEGIELRAAGIAAPIVVLGGVPEGAEDAIVATGLRPVVWTRDHLDRLDAAVLRHAGGRVRVHVKVDTGMSRLGVLPSDLPALLDRLRQARDTIVVEGLMTHFARAGDADGEAATRAQHEAFVACVPEVTRALGREPPLLHCANSAALARFGWTHLDLVRPGIALYGGAPRAELALPGLRPALSFHSEVVDVRELPAKARVGYGGHGRLDRPSRLAVVPVGYADGYPHAASGRGEVLVRGRRCPLVGDVSMDISMVDVTDVPGVRPGDRVTLLGRQGDAEIGLFELCGWTGLLPYEVTCGISKRVPRHGR